ncbi:glutaredoxin family protein [Nocardioidaceae bacterium SCSIO 66511]|nr:glutaredoxin family protein [Nocardioidaceae bacterium SCSIO 66511]
MTEQPRVEVLTKPGCHLCENAVAIIESVCSELGVGWSESDISADAEAMRTYGEQIPVTFVDGRQHDFWRVDPARLRKALGRT